MGINTPLIFLIFDHHHLSFTPSASVDLSLQNCLSYCCVVSALLTSLLKSLISDMSSLQAEIGPDLITKITAHFDYDEVLALPFVKKRAFYYNVVLFIENVIIKKSAFFVKLLNFIRIDIAVYNDANVLFMIKNHFFNIHTLYQASRSTENKKQAALNTIEKH